MIKRSNARSAGWVLGVVLGAAASLGRPAVARATEAESVTLEDDTSAPAKKPEKKDDEESKVKHVTAPYHLPWQLRPVLPSTYVRLDNSFAFYGVGGSTIVNVLTASYRFIPRVSALVRIATALDNPADNSPATGGGGFGFVNPLIGAQAGFWPVKGLKVGLFLGFTLPIGMGGGDTPNLGSQDTIFRAMLARSGFDNPLFMPNYFTVWPGLDVAYVSHGFTGQLELSLPVMNNVRGPSTEKTTNAELTVGLHGGYFIFPWMSAGLELRYQRWITNAAVVANDPSGQLRDLFTIEPGFRFHIPINETVTFRPALALGFGLDQPMAGSSYKILRLDFPFTF
jgi:hypothetical protein